MGNCYQKLPCIKFGQCRSTDYGQIALLLVGLDNAGKTTFANGLSGKLTSSVLPTVGFSSINLRFKRHPVILFDVGGGPQIRRIWSQYYGNVHGFIFVIDASDIHRLNECKEVFSNMIWHDKVSGKPILICLNKQDKEGTMHEFDITEQMDVEKLVNLRQCPTKVEVCSGLPFEQTSGCRHFYSADPNLIAGFRWLVSYILLNYETLNSRVINDEKLQVEAAETRRNKWKAQRKGVEAHNPEPAPDSNFKNPFVPISSYLKEVDSNQAVKNGSVNKILLPPIKKSQLKNVDVVIERHNDSLPPVEVNNARNSRNKSDPSSSNHISKHQKSFSDRKSSDEDDSDVSIFYSRSKSNQDDSANSQHDLSVFTISGKNVKPEGNVGINLDQKSLGSTNDGTRLLWQSIFVSVFLIQIVNGKKNSAKAFLPFRRHNKTSPAPNSTSGVQETAHNGFFSRTVEKRPGSSKSAMISQMCPVDDVRSVPSSNTRLNDGIASNAIHESPQNIRSKTKGIFSRVKPITSSTECILTDSDSADVVL